MSFSIAIRERFLALLAVGYSVEAAAAAAGTSRTTVARWAARGREPGASPDHATFAARLDAIREGAAEDVAQRQEAEQEPTVPVFGDADFVDSLTWLSPEDMT